MNPIIEVLARYFAKGQSVTEVAPSGDSRSCKGFLVTLSDGQEISHSLTADSQEEFVTIWKDAAAWSRIKWKDAGE